MEVTLWLLRLGHRKLCSFCLRLWKHTLWRNLLLGEKSTILRLPCCDGAQTIRIVRMRGGHTPAVPPLWAWAPDICMKKCFWTSRIGQGFRRLQLLLPSECYHTTDPKGSTAQLSTNKSQKLWEMKIHCLKHLGAVCYATTDNRNNHRHISWFLPALPCC